MTLDSVLISKAELLAFAGAIFIAAGCSRAHADEWANMLIWANLRGVDSHGVIRIPRYLDLLRRKSINAAPNMRTLNRDELARQVASISAENHTFEIYGRFPECGADQFTQHPVRDDDPPG